MILQHDRLINISVGNSRKSLKWIPQKIMLSDFYESLKTPTRGTETQAEYFKMKKSEQDDLKDARGGFVGGTFKGERRKAADVTGRDLVTLDLDTIPAFGVDKILNKAAFFGCSYCIYSTRKHTPNAPRLRVLIPLDRTVTTDEYEPIARRIAQFFGMGAADPTTFDVARLFYYPTASADGEYIYKYGDGPLCVADRMLESYTDWRDWGEWPQVPGSVSYQRLAVKQGEPTEKAGVVGTFCRCYDIYEAMETFLPGIYAPVENAAERYTYLGGTTAGGAIVYDNGAFLYSHHATDPCSNKLVNSFDLVRLHKFGDLDDGAAYNTPSNRLPSYKAMCDFAIADKKVAAAIVKERHDSAVSDFAGLTPPPTTDSADATATSGEDGEGEATPVDGDGDGLGWMERLQVNAKGQIRPTIDNIMIILDNDPQLKGKFALNEFASRGEVLGALPWDQNGARRLWSDTDSNGLYWYLERFYNLTGRGNIDAALDVHASAHRFNDIVNYLKGLTWDGVPRLDTLFIDYLGAEDNSYTRAVTRKSFVAAVARAMSAGCKFDNMLILCGPQGIGKSSILDKMSRGWFNDSIRTFEGKEASELLQGVWIVEVAELDAFRRTDVARIKQFLSLRVDRYRAAYGRNVKELPRRCVFFGTCNQMDFLQDTTGNRRFWPVDVGITTPARHWSDLDDATISQIWAEAKARYTDNEQTYLTGEIEAAAKERQEMHRETSAKEGPIQDFVAQKVPADWQNWPLNRRRDYWATNAGGSYTLVERDRISAVEVWCELFNGSMRDLKNADAREINGILSNVSGWKRSDKTFRNGPYGVQRGYIRG